MPLKTGRYVPKTGNESRLTLRVERLSEATEAGDTLVVSGDLVKARKLHSFLSVSKRGKPAVRYLTGGAKPVLEVDVLFGVHNYKSGRRGTVRVVFDSAREGRARLLCPAQSVNLDTSLKIRWKDRFFRDLTIELDKIRDAAFPTKMRQDGVEWSVKRIFEETGFKTRIVKSQRGLADELDGWTAGELHQAMEDNRRDLGNWSSYVFLTSFVIDENGDEDRDTMGWMFDTADEDLNFVPREASAVFDEAVRAYTREFFGRLTPSKYQRELIITTAHEVGHAFNLSHSFNKEREDSNSVMNYPEEYKGGEHEEEYYEDLEFSFDRGELDRLRHHSPLVVEPGREGGEDFFEADTFRRAMSETRGRLRLLSKVKQRIGRDFLLKLNLDAKEILPREPLVVTVGLDKRSWRGRAASLRLGTQLDWETGGLKFAVRPPEKKVWSVLDAPIKRCRAKRTLQMAKGKECSVTAELLMSRGGEIFDKPGDYELCALLSVSHGGASTVLKSRPARIRVRAPKGDEDWGLCRLYETAGLKRLLLMPGAAISTDARAAAEELHERARDRVSGQLATMALIKEARSFERGRARAVAKRFLDPKYQDDCHNWLATKKLAGTLFERRIKGVRRLRRRLRDR